jgi:hypothetical protein
VHSPGTQPCSCARRALHSLATGLRLHRSCRRRSFVKAHSDAVASPFTSGEIGAGEIGAGGHSVAGGIVGCPGRIWAHKGRVAKARLLLLIFVDAKLFEEFYIDIDAQIT